MEATPTRLSEVSSLVRHLPLLTLYHTHNTSHHTCAEYPGWQPFKNDTTLETQYQYLLRESGCGDIGCLRSLGATALANATQKVYVDAYMAGQYGYGTFS